MSMFYMGNLQAVGYTTHILPPQNDAVLGGLFRIIRDCRVVAIRRLGSGRLGAAGLRPHRPYRPQPIGME